MIRFLLFLLLGCAFSIATYAQTPVQSLHTFGNVVGATPSWVKVGRLTMAQGGYTASFKFYAGVGFNGYVSQNASVELFVRTSNGSAMGDRNYPFAATASRSGLSDRFITRIKIVPDVPGASPAAYDIYIYTGIYIGQGYYEATVTGSWTHAMTATADPGAGYEVPLEFRTLDDSYLAGGALFASSATSTVGIGVTDTKGYKLAVGGSMIAERIKVKLQSAWPDYVFHETYRLPSLQELQQYIQTHRHLPDIPEAQEVAREGIDVGEMNKKLVQKIELPCISLS
ncbi:hypothetical protein HF329_05505 [Chitinophaga oryzae]|uniref:Uncharacterized protein n=1 Tax=Chitinophaga oryzae TaxID=2725414 RepID=A0AAE6ZFX3_9BACT|nr:hypothetical protein [Chitinophaga oryzae]QJB30782.1 hypothetical protein HF329_05505 [Chitinophaga oryzae]